MKWAKLDSNYWANPKIIEAGPLAELLQVRAICYCCDHETDGFLPMAIVPILIRGFDDFQMPGSAGSESKHPLTARGWTTYMVECGLWEPENRGGYQVHDFLEYQMRRASMRMTARMRSASARKAANARWERERAMRNRICGSMREVELESKAKQDPKHLVLDVTDHGGTYPQAPPNLIDFQGQQHPAPDPKPSATDPAREGLNLARLVQQRRAALGLETGST